MGDLQGFLRGNTGKIPLARGERRRRGGRGGGLTQRKCSPRNSLRNQQRFSWPEQCATLRALSLQRNPAGSSRAPIAPPSRGETHRRSQPLQSEARNAKTTPESAICGVPLTRPAPKGSVARHEVAVFTA